jgi:hypothetical protein
MLKIESNLHCKQFIEEHSIPITECGCWLWDCEECEDDLVQLDGKIEKIDHVAYEAFYGKLPNDSDVVHDCHVACCVNPRHMHST